MQMAFRCVCDILLKALDVDLNNVNGFDRFPTMPSAWPQIVFGYKR